MGEPAGKVQGKAEHAGPPVVPLELFFDLVFVFVLSQITHAIEDDLSPYGIGRGLIYLLLVWSAWVGFAWVGNAHRAEDRSDGGIPRRLIIIAAMAVLIALGLVVPEAGQDITAESAAVLYLALFILYAGDFLLATRGDPAMRRTVLRLLAIQSILPLILLVVGFGDWGAWDLILVGSGLLIAYVAPALTPDTDWQFSAAHADERFSLLMLIVLGESLISVGLGAADNPFGWPVVATICLGVLIVAALWWQYFDLLSHQGEAYLESLEPAERIRKARLIYSYLHVLLVVAVILMALGLTAASSDPDLPLSSPQATFLPGGIALFLLTLAVIRRVMRGRVLWPLPLAALGTLLVIPLAYVLPALASEAICVVILGTLVTAREIYKRRGVIQPIH